MKKTFIHHVSLLCVLLFSAQVKAQAEPQMIYWGSVHYPPIFIQKGPYKDQGMMDIVTRALQDRLPGYNHTPLLLNLPRLMSEMKSGTQICFAGLFKTPEREKFISFSQEFQRVSPTLLVTSAKMKERIREFQDETDKVNLRALLSSQSITLDIPEGRAFGPNIDQMIHKQDGGFHPSINIRKGKTKAKKYVKLIALERIDATLAHGLETYYQAINQEVSDQIAMFQLQNEEEQQPIFVGCAKGAWLTAFLPNLNRAIGEIVQKDIPIHARNRWLPKNLKQ